MLLAAIVQPTIEKAHRATDEIQKVRNLKICLGCVYLGVRRNQKMTLRKWNNLYDLLIQKTLLIIGLSS